LSGGIVGSSGTDTFMLNTGTGGMTDTDDQFTGFGRALNGSTESVMQVEIFMNFNVVRISVNVATNSRSGTITLSFRDDGSNAGTVSITNGTTGQFDSGVISEAVASGSLINVMYNLSVGSGTLEVRQQFYQMERS